ncbi:5-carboxymethyl-2-hydroxymuconate Delta-isomerase [Roseibium polysiphoniae]|uniref:5-carboxymethyl-2-hydroxymuconate Delta-isomerase n=1 Tax=Roseibium polysiphoniae TaxID=2571221 RepID=UPI003299E752
MPHFVIEYSAPSETSLAIDFAALMKQLGQAAADTGVMKLEDIKLRSIPFESFRLNDGSRSFLHLTVSLLEGRTPQQKAALALTCRTTLVSLCPDINAISVDIRDMDGHAYKKRVSGGRPLLT